MGASFHAPASHLASIWIPALGLVLIEHNGLVAKAVANYGVFGNLGMSAFVLLLWALIATGAYTVALGSEVPAAFARVEIGGAELRYFFAKVAFFLIVNGMLLGAAIFRDRIALFVQARDVLVSPDPNLTVAQWAGSLGPGAWALILSPLAFALFVIAWFGARFSLVFPAACAQGRFAMFEALALTRRNAWHMFGLILLLGASLALAFWFIAAAGGMWDLTHVRGAAATNANNPMVLLQKTASAISAASSSSAWLAVLLGVGEGAVWQIVFAGRPREAYRTLKPAE